MLRRRAPIIVFGLVLVLGAVAGFTVVWPRTYRSSALIVIEQRTGTGDATLALLGQLGRASQIETEIELLQSRHVVERVVDQLDLHATVEPPAPEPGDSVSFIERLAEHARRVLPAPPPLRAHAVFPNFDAARTAAPGRYRVALRADGPEGAIGVWDAVSGRGVVAVPPDGDGPATIGDSAWLDWSETGRVVHFAGVTLTPPDSAPWPAFDLRVESFAGAVTATRDRVSASRRQRDADLIEVECEGRTPQGARELCQAILDSYMRLRMDLRRAEATATAQFLREEVNQLGERLRSAEDSLEAYGTRYGVVALGERAAEEVRQFTLLTAQRDQLHAERSALSGLIDRIRRRGTGANGTRQYRDLASFPTFLRNSAVTQLMVSLVTLENDRSDLLLRRSETSTEVTVLDARIREIEQQLLSIALSHRAALNEQIRSLDEALRTAGTRIAAIPRRQVQAARLERDAGLWGDLYALLETRLREAEVAEAVNLPNVRVVDQASLPLAPSHPKLRLNLILGSVLGLAFGLMLAMYRESTDDSIRERRDVERRFGLPVLAVTPRLDGAPSILPLPVLHRPRDSATLTETPRFLLRKRGSKANGHGERPHPKYRMTEDRRAALESFRALALDLRFVTNHLNGGAPTVAVTSAVRGEGKTFVACNLALARAAQGARTLLIDGDIRGGGAMRFFGLPSSAPGLSDVLAASPAVNADEGVWKGAVSSAELWVIPPGTPSLYSARIFEFPKFATLLEQAKLQFDLIVIDTPPINVITDAAPIAAVCDAVLLVVRGSFTTRDCLELTLERLGRARGYVVGAVLNDVEPPAHYATGYEYAEAVELRT